MGHLYEAAVAYYQATGKDNLLKVAEKNAQHINHVFFEGDPKYNDGKPVNQAPGHEEIELALVKLYRITGKPLYLDTARRFLEIRGVTYKPEGEGAMSPVYAQQHAPVKEQREAVGHAVRAAYLYSGMADVGALTGDKGYVAALDSIWSDIVNTRMHLTGGLGAIHGIEGFGPHYDLPNADAYDETCAAVGNVFFNFRMFLMEGDAKYLDVAEVALYNNVLAGVNLEGNRFFYVNPLESDGEHPFNDGASGRVEWFETACCPSNLARLVPQVPGMAYAHHNLDVYVAFYVGSRTQLRVADTNVKIAQDTEYPNDGLVRITFDPEAPARFRLLLRMPTWTRDRFVPGELYHFADKVNEPVTIRVNGRTVAPIVERGFAVIDREWRPGDRVELNLPMPVRFSTARLEVQADRDRVAATRGPFVLCAEGVDNGGPVQRYVVLSLPDTRGITPGRTDIASGSFLNFRLPAAVTTPDGQLAAASLILIPYYAWNNRGNSTMAVWFARRPTTLTHEPFGRTPDGTAVERYTLRNTNGMEAKIMTYGGIVTSITAPDRRGDFADAVLGYDTLAGYLKESPYFGALIGRYGNRIAKGQFTLDGKTHSLAINNPPNSLRGGKVGFDKVVWKVAKAELSPQGPQLTLTYLSRNGEEGYPGNLNVAVVYTLTDDNALRLDYTATTDQPTIVNLTQHSYFNLCGRGDNLAHVLQIRAGEFTPVDATLIPTGELRSVEGTPFDFRRPTAIGARINTADEQLKFGRGYDHNWVINGKVGTLRQLAEVYEPETGRVLEVHSTEPSLQFYSGNFLDGTITGKGGWIYQFRAGFCLEPQHYPDSPNRPDFPPVVLKPSEIYRNTIIYRFSAK